MYVSCFLNKRGGNASFLCYPINEKTPVISRSLFINQKTNSHDKLL